MSFEQVFKDAIKKSEEAHPIKDGDYIGEDGLWYCGNCKTRKQSQVTALGKTYKPFCLCDCEAQKLQEEEEARKQKEFAEKVKDLRRVGFPDADMLQWTFANDDMENEQITKAMKRYVENFPELRKQGKGLLLYGSVGRGKTYAACEVANALIDKGYSVLVTNFSRVLNTLQSTFEKQEYIDSLNDFSLLVIDDLGIERSTEYAKEQVYNVIDSRYRAGLPMIITTNLSIDKIKNPVDIENGRIYDRIIERCFPIEVKGQNRRHKAVRESYGDMKELLGL
jgi:DNA replication protein DnaC